MRVKNYLDLPSGMNKHWEWVVALDVWDYYRVGKNAGKRVNRLIKNILGLGGKTHHCFRHTVATKLKQKLVPEPVAASIIGHSYGGMTYGHYGKDFEPQMLVNAIEIIKYLA